MDKLQESHKTRNWMSYDKFLSYVCLFLEPDGNIGWNIHNEKIKVLNFLDNKDIQFSFDELITH